MKFIILILIFSCCKVSDKHPGFDPEDIYRWTIRTSNSYYIGNGSTGDTMATIDIFVKNNNELKWFSKTGIRTFYIQLSSYGNGYYTYISFESPSMYVNYFSVDFVKKTIFVTPDYTTGRIYKE